MKREDNKRIYTKISEQFNKQQYGYNNEYKSENISTILSLQINWCVLHAVTQIQEKIRDKIKTLTTPAARRAAPLAAVMSLQVPSLYPNDAGSRRDSPLARADERGIEPAERGSPGSEPVL